MPIFGTECHVYTCTIPVRRRNNIPTGFPSLDIRLTPTEGSISHSRSGMGPICEPTSHSHSGMGPISESKCQSYSGMEPISEPKCHSCRGMGPISEAKCHSNSFRCGEATPDRLYGFIALCECVDSRGLCLCVVFIVVSSCS